MAAVPPLSPTRQKLLLAAVMSGLLLAMLDQTIVGTALPRIVESLGGAHLYVWVVTAYLVPATVSVPIYAHLSDRFGRQRLLLTGMALFLAGSALAALAQGMPELIGFRALQGLGAGALEGLTFILVADLYGGRRSAALMAALAGLMGVSFIAGPLLGGVLTDHVGWRAVFTVKLPIGAAAMAIVAAVLPRAIGRHDHGGARFDVAGVALLTLAVGLVLVGLGERSDAAANGALPAWTEPRTGGLVLAGLALLAPLVVVERRAAAPLIPLSLLTAPRSRAILIAGATGGFGMFATALLLPRYFQLTRGVSATQSGVLIYPLLLGLLLSVNATGRAIMRRGEFRTPLLAGSLLVAGGALGFATFGAGTPGWRTALFMALIGLGAGPAFSGAQIALQRSLPPQRIGAALGTLMLARQIGASVALAAATTIYASGATPAAATGRAVLWTALAGAALAAAALATLPRGAARLTPMPAARTPESAAR